MTSGLFLTCLPVSEVVPVLNQTQTMNVLCEISGGEGAGSLPLNLGLVIDCSDSMRIRLVTEEQFSQLAGYGQAQEVITDGVPAFQISAIPSDLLVKFPRRIDYVAEALTIASDYLRPADHFCLAAFASQSLLLVNSVSGVEKSRLQQLARGLENLSLGDETHIAAGLALAFDELHKQQNRSQSSRLILLTDGHTRDVSDCYAWAKRAHEAGISLTTMGIGNEFNEELLIPLADITGGNAYYIESPQQIPEAFHNELGAALRVSYSNVDIRLQLPAGVNLNAVYRVHPDLGAFDQGQSQNGFYTLLLGNYDPALPIGLLLELQIPPWMPGRYRLAQATLAWDDPAGETTRLDQRLDIVINTAISPTIQKNPRVMNIIEKVNAFMLGNQALEAALSGDRSMATIRLRQAATRLLDMGESRLASQMNSQASAIENGQPMDSNATKKLRYETRHLTQHEAAVKE